MVSPAVSGSPSCVRSRRVNLDIVQPRREVKVSRRVKIWLSIRTKGLKKCADSEKKLRFDFKFNLLYTYFVGGMLKSAAISA